MIFSSCIGGVPPRCIAISGYFSSEYVMYGCKITGSMRGNHRVHIGPIVKCIFIHVGNSDLLSGRWTGACMSYMYIVYHPYIYLSDPKNIPNKELFTALATLHCHNKQANSCTKQGLPMSHRPWLTPSYNYYYSCLLCRYVYVFVHFFYISIQCIMNILYVAITFLGGR